ncbi:MAG TPA: YchJ family protein, partial [Geobacteraceae bacterium]|nr:YchJ family protein [Geobacteraceae bacterium]
MTSCPCGSGSAYADCCEPIITGARPAKTAEQLMRARYSAYVGVQTDFLFASTHPDHRKGYDHQGTKEWAENAHWEGLEIVASQGGEEPDGAGRVEFIARYREKGATREHHELARFRMEKGAWYFTEGAMVKPRPLVSAKTGRNDPCPCG